MNLRTPTLAALALCAANALAAASPKILQQDNVSLALANEPIDATLKACRDDGRSAVVVDRAAAIRR